MANSNYYKHLKS